MKKYDAIVIGSGGGTKLVRPVAAMGKKVAVIEKGRLGGTCLNHGCIPSKMLIHTGEVCDLIREAHKYNVTVDTKIEVHFKELVERVNATIDADSDKIGPMYDNDPNVDLYRGEGQFVSDKMIRVGGEVLTSDKIFIAVGARPHVPDIEGLESTPYMTYYEALRQTTLPKKLVILGAGYIATELGYFFASIGVETHFLVRSTFIKQEDIEVQEEFSRVFAEKYPVHFGAVPTKVSHDGNEFTITCSNGEVIKSDAFLVATGITPWTDTLGLENTSIRTDPKGFIEVDNHFRTTQEGVWALGDCIGKYFFRHSVNFEGEYLFRTLFANPSPEPIEYPPVPHAVFTNPEVASVGYTEQELDGVDYVVGKASYRKSARGMALMPDHGFVKLIFEKRTRQLIGAHIIGPEASNMIHLPIGMMNMAATIDDMLHMIYIHPALPEIVRNAARNAATQM